MMMVEISQLPSFYLVSTSCITRLLLAKLFLFYTFFTEPWLALSSLLELFIRSIPGLPALNISPIPLLTPLLSAEIVADTMVMMGLCWKSRMCLIPWLILNMTGIFATSFILVNKMSTSLSGIVLHELELNRNLEIHLLVCLVSLLLLLCIQGSQYSAVLNIYFQLQWNCISLRKDTVPERVEQGKVYSPVPLVSPSNMFLEQFDKRKVSRYPPEIASGSIPLLPVQNSSYKSSFLQENGQQSSFLHDVSEMNSFHQDIAAPEIRGEQRRADTERSSLSSNLDKQKSSSSLLTRRAESLCLDGDNARNSWNTFKFAFNDENFS